MVLILEMHLVPWWLDSGAANAAASWYHWSVVVLVASAVSWLWSPLLLSIRSTLDPLHELDASWLRHSSLVQYLTMLSVFLYVRATMTYGHSIIKMALVPLLVLLLEMILRSRISFECGSYNSLGFYLIAETLVWLVLTTCARVLYWFASFFW